MKSPVLTDDQLLRLRRLMVLYRFHASLREAEKFTSTTAKCSMSFYKFADSLLIVRSGLYGLGIDDIVDLYSLNDDDKPVFTVDDLFINPNCTHKKVESLSNCTHKKPKKRGKQKKPVMVHYRLRLPVSMLDDLRALEGSVSEHVRRAIEVYLLSCNSE